MDERIDGREANGSYIHDKVEGDAHMIVTRRLHNEDRCIVMR